VAAGLAAVDTSVLIAWQTPTEPRHAEATTMMATWPDKVLHSVNLAEFLTGYPESVWPNLLVTLTRNGVTWRDTTPETLAQARRDTGLRMPDACVIAVARSAGAVAVLTLDRKLRQAATAEGFA